MGRFSNEVSWSKASGAMMSWNIKQGSSKGSALQSEGKYCRSEEPRLFLVLIWIQKKTFTSGLSAIPVSWYHHVDIIKDSNTIQFHSSISKQALQPFFSSIRAQSSSEKILLSVPHSRTFAFTNPNPNPTSQSSFCDSFGMMTISQGFQTCERLCCAMWHKLNV